MIERRTFLGMIASALLAAPRAVGAQQGGKVPRVGFVEAGAVAVNRHYLDAFRQGLRDLGYVEGQSIVVEDRWADGRSERFPELLDELVRRRVDVIVQASTPGAVAAKKATSTVPVVFWGVTDPVGLGLVASLAHPAGNMTGLVLGAEEGFAGKWLEILKDAVPTLSRVGVLSNPEARGLEPRVSELATAAPRLGVVLQRFPARSADELKAAFAAMGKARIGGLIVITDPLTLRHRVQIVNSAAEARLPTVYGFGEFARSGGLMAYGPSVADLARRAATYVDKILKGAKPADLPVEQPTKFELVINLKTGKALGLTIPPSLLQRADHVIE
ncbi:MAG TPA: ABC transporter substrate-binding protein [Methylomirabilota bacterium]|nr:ABC transporter substrate-binding protein [Methylomirabilota bacterium]